MPALLRGRAIVLFLPQPEPEAVCLLRRQFDPLFGTLAAHVTLVFPFESDLAPGVVRAHVERAVDGVGPISVRLAGVTGARDVSGADKQYLFLNVRRGNDALVELHDRLYRGPLAGYRSREYPYLPHVTVGRLYGDAPFRAALAIASSASIDFEATLETVTVFAAATCAPESQVALDKNT